MRRAALLLGVLAACGGPAEELRPLRAGDAAPAYAAVTLSGDSVVIPGQDEPVLLNVWATWCVPCRHEMPALQALHDSVPQLVVLGVSIDAAGDDAVIRGFLDEYDITFPVAHDPRERVVRAFRTTGVPETFLIGRDGRIANRWIGPIDRALPEVRRAIDAAVAEG